MKSEILNHLIDHFNRLPGIGPKTAERLVYSLLKRSRLDLQDFAQTLLRLQETIHVCSLCHDLSEKDPCSICADKTRDPHTLCVVAEGQDVAAIERTRQYHGRYHVLGGVINQIEGIGPDKLNIAHLVSRIDNEAIHEVILATNPDMEGESTALYLAQLLKKQNITLTRLARGLPMGADVEYADEITLGNAITGRRTL